MQLQHGPQELENPKSEGTKGQVVVFWIIFILFVLISFRAVWPSSNVLFSTDDNMGALALRKRALPHAFLGWWVHSPLAGTEEMANLNWTNLLLWLLPLRWFTNWIHAIDLSGASLFLWLFLQRRGISPAARALGILAAFWVGSNLTLTYAGHIGKYGVLLFASVVLWLTEVAVTENRWRHWIWLGAAFAAMVLEQPDLAVFFSLVLGPYVLYALWREQQLMLRKTWFKLVVAGLVAGLLSFRGLWLGYETAVQGVATVEKEDPEERWNFLTQWSWPPEESIDFIAPGFMGLRSGEPEGPYWGRMGRSAEWEKTRRGFQNFKLESQYLGIFPIFFGLLALGWLLEGTGGRRNETLFWLLATLVTLLLSFGKYFPLYRLFAMLPVVSTIRNPNKFLQIFQIGLGVMAAFGVDWACKRLNSKAYIRWPLWVISGTAILLLLSAVGASTAMEKTIARFVADGWGRFADIIVRRQIGALWHATIVAALCAGSVFTIGKFNGRVRDAIFWVIPLVVAGDSVLLGRHYIQPMPRAAYQSNEVLTYLKENLEPGRRVAVVAQDGFYNFWLTYNFPFEDIPAVNVTQMPRMPKDYAEFLQALGRDPLKLWQLFAVQYVLMPNALWKNAKQEARWAAALEPVLGFNVRPFPDGFGYTCSAMNPEGSEHVVLRLRIPAPFLVPMGTWREVNSSEILQVLASASHDPLKEMLLEPLDTEGLSTLAFSAPHGDVRFLKARPGYWQLQVAVEHPVVVRFAQRFSKNWKVWVDRKYARLRRCDYLFQSVEVPTGTHEIILEYAAAPWTLYVQLGGFVLVGLSVIWPRRLG